MKKNNSQTNPGPQAEMTTQAVNKTPGLTDEKNKTLKKWHKIVIAIFLILLVPTGTVAAFEEIFSQRIYLRVEIGGLKVGGKTKDQAMEILNGATKKINENGLVFSYQGRQAAIMPIVTAADDPDLSRTAFSLENEKTVEAAFSLGRGGDLLDNLKNQFFIFLSGAKVAPLYQANSEEMKKILEENFGYLEEAPKDAQLEFLTQNGKTEATASGEKSGKIFNYDEAIRAAFSKFENLDYSPTTLDIATAEPKIKKSDTAGALPRAKQLYNLCPITVSEGNKTWLISADQIREWLSFQQTSSGVGVGLDQTKVESYMQNLAKEIDTKPQNAKLKIEDGVVKEFQLHQGGKEVNLAASYQAINNYVLNFDVAKISSQCLRTPPPEDVVHLVINITAPQIPIGSLNNLGIKELVGVGESDFSGSPANRRHNIATGAAKLNGTLIPPGEEFSINKVLGNIDAAAGYLPELVIKGDKTTPEYGGGLCQIGTTMFRVALNAGLPITERRPHSYRVVYYEPAGMDATIYSPKPDLRFINDTPSYLLLQTKIDGNILTFELWGTSDGRKVELTQPKIYNITSPGPTKIIETEDLAPGQKKCTERAHAGADAEFSRTVTTAAGETKTEEWKSHYVPWSAVCLVGKAPGEPAAPETASPPTDSASELPPDPALQNTSPPTTF